MAPEFLIPVEGVKDRYTVDAFHRVADTLSIMWQEGPAAERPARSEFGAHYFETDGGHRLWWYCGMGLGEGGSGWLLIYSQTQVDPGDPVALVPGQVLFGGATGLIAQDAGLTYNPTTDVLTIGTLAGILKATAGAISALAPTRGDIISAQGGTPTWEKLAAGDPGDVLIMGANEPAWGAGGAGEPHNLLSVTHTDTLAAAAARGSLLVGNATPNWAALAVGAANSVLQANGTDAGWTPTPTLASLTLATGNLTYGNAGFSLLADTADGSDTKRVNIGGGGALGSGRGAEFDAFGNDWVVAAGWRGTALIAAGAPGTTGTYDGMVLFFPNYTLAWMMDRSGHLLPATPDAVNIGDASHEVGTVYVGSGGVYIGPGQEFRIYKDGAELIIG